MLIPIVLIFLGIFGLVFFLKTNTQRRNMALNALEDERNSMQAKFDHMVEQRKELQKTLQEKEDELSRIHRGQTGIQTMSTKDMNIGEVNESDKVSRYLLKEGKITLEQHEKTQSKMSTLKMDYLGACLALGYIDINTAKKAAKINKLSANLKG